MVKAEEQAQILYLGDKLIELGVLVSSASTRAFHAFYAAPEAQTCT